MEDRLDKIINIVVYHLISFKAIFVKVVRAYKKSTVAQKQVLTFYVLEPL